MCVGELLYGLWERLVDMLQVSAHAELMWILSAVASMGYLSRMTQWKVCNLTTWGKSRIMLMSARTE